MIAEDRSMGAAHSLLAPRNEPLELGKMCKDQNRWKSRFEVIFVYMDTETPNHPKPKCRKLLDKFAVFLVV
jgi:hypothetical protein